MLSSITYTTVEITKKIEVYVIESPQPGLLTNRKIFLQFQRGN